MSVIDLIDLLGLFGVYAGIILFPVLVGGATPVIFLATFGVLSGCSCCPENVEKQHVGKQFVWSELGLQEEFWKQQ